MVFGLCHGTRVNMVKQIKVDCKWTLRSIPKKKSGHYDWAALPDGDYFVEWRDDGRRRRQPAGNTAAQAMEEQRRKRHELEAHALGLAPRNQTSEEVTPAEPASVRKLLDRYLDQIKTLKKLRIPGQAEHYSGLKPNRIPG